jgi:ribonuclease HII
MADNPKTVKQKQKLQKEIQRFKDMSFYEEEAYSSGTTYVAGIDEAGRGPLAGPVVASCVILDPTKPIYRINDSKKLSEKAREEIYSEIMEKAIAVGIGIVDEKEIDDINILNATKKAMVIAVNDLKVSPQLLLVDAVELDEISIEQKTLTKGDSLSVSIAAASIIAKVTRDRILIEMDKKYPVYGFKKHKGYGTKEHIDAIKKFGICPIHRLSFTKKYASSHIILGKNGEELAAKYLSQNGYQILERNFRLGKLGEIDIIAKHKEFVCFIEVKTRSGNSYGAPSEAVNQKKQHTIRKLAWTYLKKMNLQDNFIRFDIVEVIGNSKEGNFAVESINLLENAF